MKSACADYCTIVLLIGVIFGFVIGFVMYKPVEKYILQENNNGSN